MMNWFRLLKRNKLEKMEKKPTIFGQKFVLEYAENYFNLPWYEKDLMRYYSYYKDMSDQQDYYFKNKKVVSS